MARGGERSCPQVHCHQLPPASFPSVCVLMECIRKVGEVITVWEACGRWEVILGTVRNWKLSEPCQYREEDGCW